MTLARESAKVGLRAQVGKVCQDQNSPANYIETVESSVAVVEGLVTALEELNGKLDKGQPKIELVVTYVFRHCAINTRSDMGLTKVDRPRFLPTCSEALLRALASVAKKHNLRIMSHLSESTDEVEYSQSLYGPHTDTYLFQKFGLLTENSLWAHCTHLSTEDIETFKATKACIGHCPLSNSWFSSRCFPAREALLEGIPTGLGKSCTGIDFTTFNFTNNNR